MKKVDIKLFRDLNLDQLVAALSFFSLVSMVPILGVLVSLSTIFHIKGLNARSWENLFLTYLSPGPGTLFAQKVSSIAERASAELIGMTGFVIGLFVLNNILSRIDRSIQNIWQTKRKTSYLKKTILFVSLYFIIVPAILLFMALALHLFPSETSILDSKLIPLLVLFAVIAFVYWYVPNCKVNIKAALLGAGAAALVIVGTKEIFISLVKSLFKYNEIYGSFASIPLLFLWVYFFWFTMVLGAIGSRYLHTSGDH